MDIFLSGSPGELRFTLAEEDKVRDIALWWPGAPDGWGDQYIVRILSRAPSFEGAFVQLDNRKNGFLTTKKILQEGQLVRAQIIRSAQKNKGPRLKLLSPELAKNENNIGLLQTGPHPLEDLLIQAPQACIYYHEASLAAQIPAKYSDRLKRLSRDHFEFLEAEWSELLESTIDVGPLIAHINVTPALTAIDLDASSSPDFAANIEAFPFLVRQIRLRNLSGTLLIDPAGIHTRKRAALVPFFERALQKEKDPLNPRILGLTPSGLIEVTRPARRPPLLEALSSPYGQGLAILRHILRENLQGSTLNAPVSIIQALDSDPRTINYFEREWGRKLHLSICCHSVAPSWRLS